MSVRAIRFLARGRSDRDPNSFPSSSEVENEMNDISSPHFSGGSLKGHIFNDKKIIKFVGEYNQL
jgi:hypothetical protein